jgi:hypothetical protein
MDLPGKRYRAQGEEQRSGKMANWKDLHVAFTRHLNFRLVMCQVGPHRNGKLAE